ncbi:hypothetical protein C0995_008604 [Termitomyces sp. Mi166|nr:hypothetical protein C0995_008604 [Termitomyces sp. Mi166\
MEARSRSPSRRISFGLQALGAKLSRTLSRDRGNDDKDADTRSISTTGSKDRSVSRGRDVYQSSGRGGAGNIRRASISRDARPTDGPDDFSVTRGREPAPGVRPTFSTGRGGAGNIRSPSRGPGSDLVEGDTGLSDAEVIRAYVAASADVPVSQTIDRSFIEQHSSGRGGAGNIFNSRSRSGSRGPTILTSPTSSTATPPRGRAPNSSPGTVTPPHTHLSPTRLTGRGGAGNFGFANTDGNERHTHIPLGPARSTGRGGAGNFGFAGADGSGVPEGISEYDEDEEKKRELSPVNKNVEKRRELSATLDGPGWSHEYDYFAIA